MRVRRAAALIAYWEHGDFVLHNYVTDKKATVSPAVLALLACLEAPIEADAVRRIFDDADAASVVDKLLDCDLLLFEGSEAETADAAIDRWKWGHDARFFHFSTQHVLYETAAKQAADLHAHALRHPPPSPFKSLEVSRRIALEEPRETVECGLLDVLARRRTVREFAREPITYAELSTILRWTWGVTRVVENPPIGTHVLKTSPSGGARHPIEVYPLVLRVDGLASGLYHYETDGDRLEEIERGDVEQLAVEICSGQPWIADCAALFFMTAVLERSMWKYEHSRTYRVVLMDAGHLGQTFHLVCTCLGLGPLTTAATQDRLLEDVLGIDGTAEVPLYTAAVGRRAVGRQGLEPCPPD